MEKENEIDKDEDVIEVSIYEIIFGVCMLSFAVFWVVGVLLGGSAGNGKIVNGLYYLNNHGNFTQVSKFTYLYSELHGKSLFLTHPLGIICAWIAGVNKLNKDNET